MCLLFPGHGLSTDPGALHLLPKVGIGAAGIWMWWHCSVPSLWAQMNSWEQQLKKRFKNLSLKITQCFSSEDSINWRQLNPMAFKIFLLFVDAELSKTPPGWVNYPLVMLGTFYMCRNRNKKPLIVMGWEGQNDNFAGHSHSLWCVLARQRWRLEPSLSQLLGAVLSFCPAVLF